MALPMTQDQVLEYLKAEAADDNLSPEDSEEAFNTAAGLQHLRRVFYGTPMEAHLTEMIAFADTVAEFIGKSTGVD